MTVINFFMLLGFSVCWYAGLYKIGEFFHKRNLDGVGYVVSVLFIFITAGLLGGLK